MWNVYMYTCRGNVWSVMTFQCIYGGAVKQLSLGKRSVCVCVCVKEKEREITHTEDA